MHSAPVIFVFTHGATEHRFGPLDVVVCGVSRTRAVTVKFIFVFFATACRDLFGLGDGHAAFVTAYVRDEGLPAHGC